MDLNYTNQKTLESYPVMLPKASFRYCSNPDGLLFAEIKDAPLSKEQTALELTEMLRTCFFLTKRDCVILSLLTNPYFDDLCTLLKRKDHLIDKRKVRKIYKHLFRYLSDDSTAKMYDNPIFAGSQIYKEKNMHLISKEMMGELEKRYGI